MRARRKWVIYRARCMRIRTSLGQKKTQGKIRAMQWHGQVMPPCHCIAKIAAETARAVKAPAMEKHLIADGSEGVGSTPAEFTTHIRAESEQWKRVIKQGGIKAQ